MTALIRLAEAWWPLYAVHMLETSLFILVVWAVDRWVTLDTRLQYVLWLCALVKAFVPPFYALPLPAFLFGADTSIAPAEMVGNVAWSSVPVNTLPLVLPPEPIPIVFWLFVLWGISVVVFLGFTFWRNRTFQRALGIANPVCLSRELDDLTHGSNLKVFSKASLTSPMLVGVVRPRLYLPSTWQAWTPTQLRGIVAHELAHYHNRDLWALVFQVGATVLFGLNPLIWLVNRRLAHLRELRCDEDALLKSGISPVEYGKLLYAFLDANAHPGLPALGFTEKDTPLKKRFEHVLNFKGGTMKRSKWQLAIPVLVALAVVPFSIRETYSQAPVGDQAQLSQTQIKPVKQIPPIYPEEARVKGVEGYVLMEVTIQPDGRVNQVTLLEGDPRFESAATTALNQFKFTPFTHTDFSKKKFAFVFKLSGENWSEYREPKRVVDRADFGSYLVTVAKAPQSESGVLPERNGLGMDFGTFSVEPPDTYGSKDVSLRVTLSPANASAQDLIEQKRSEVNEAIEMALAQVPLNFWENDVRGLVEGSVRMRVNRLLGARTVVDAKVHNLLVNGQTVVPFAQINNAKPFTPKSKVLDIWINTKGDLLLDLSHPTTMDAIAGELRRLKEGSQIKLVRVKVDRQTPKHLVKELLDKIAESRINFTIETEKPAQLNHNDKPIDLDNLQFFQADVKPEVIQMVPPKYPDIAQKAGLTGRVFLKFRVNEDGSVGEVTVLKGQAIFKDAAINAIQSSRFKPAEHEGKPVAVWMTQPITFRLGNGVETPSQQQIDLGAFTAQIPNEQGGYGQVQPRFVLTVASEGAEQAIRADFGKAQKSAVSYVSQVPYNQWATPEQQVAILQGVRDKINAAFGTPLVTHVSFGDLVISPTAYLMDGAEFKLHSNFPNPFNPETMIKYDVAEPVFVRMEIYTVTGQLIRTLVSENQAPGQYQVRWDGRNDQGKQVASGVYTYFIQAGSFTAFHKMQLVK